MFLEAHQAICDIDQITNAGFSFIYFFKWTFYEREKVNSAHI